MSSSISIRYPDFEHCYEQIGGLRMHYVRSGNGPELVVFLHGFPQSWYSWRHQLAALAATHTVVAPDMRGYGETDKPGSVDSYSIEKLADDVTGLIRHLGFKRASIVGHDWGAGVAWAVALTAPEYVQKLVTMQVPPLAVWRKNLSLSQLLRSWYMLFFQIPSVPEWMIRRNNFEGLRRMFKATTIRPGVFTAFDVDQYVSAVREPESLTGAVNYYRANVGRMIRPGSGRKTTIPSRINVPTMFIFGEKDFAILPQTVRGVGEFIDAAYKEVRFKNCGHWVQEELADEVNRNLLEFLGGAGESAPVAS